MTAFDTAVATGSEPLTVYSLRGRQSLMELSPELDRLERGLGVPLTARVRWACAAFQTTRALEPWVIAARHRSGHLDAGLVLSVHHEAGRLAVEIPRPGTDDRLSSRGRTQVAVETIAKCLTTSLADCGSDWSLDLTGIAPDDPIVSCLADHLAQGTTQPGIPVPGLCLDRGQSDVTPLLRADAQRSIRRSRRRLAADGIRVSVAVERHPDRIVCELDTLEAAHRARDHDAGRESDLDDPVASAFWRAVIADHAERGEVEVSALHLDDHLAAYVVAFLDPPTYRIFDGRLVTTWAQYAPGRLLESEVLGRVLRDPEFQQVDWMTCLAPEKLIAADTAEPTVNVRASS